MNVSERISKRVLKLLSIQKEFSDWWDGLDSNVQYNITRHICYEIRDEISKEIQKFLLDTIKIE
jgi:hypothetical protein